MCSAPAMPSCRVFCAAGSAARAWRRQRPGPTPAAPSPCRGCSAAPEYPTFEELQFFLKNGSRHLALRKDEAINHIHWATTRRRDIPSLMALACDHRIQLDDVAAKAGADLSRIHAFQGAGGQGGGKGCRRPRRLRHAARRKIRPRGDVRIRPPSFRLARPASRIARIAAAALRILAGYRLATDRVAGRALHQVPVLLPPRRSGGAEDRAAAEAAKACSRPRGK